MRLQFKHQKFQEDAVRAVVEVFKGQPSEENIFLLKNVESRQTEILAENFGAGNAPIQISDKEILSNVQKIQRANEIEPSEKLEKINSWYNFTIEMETGVGKTYTYIKTMYELHKNYGWKKFIIIVPSIAIREGVKKSFEVTAQHFFEEYGERIDFFIYNSARLTEIKNFAQENKIKAMIINSQAFNAKGNDARRIRMQLDEFQSKIPLEVIAAVNPILIIDEPQSVEGEQTKKSLAEFNPLFILRYSATHREFYNLIYRLDAMDAYNKKLVKKIRVTGIKAGSTATSGFVYLEDIKTYPDKPPTAVIHFDCKTKSGIRKKISNVTQGFNLYEKSNELEEYKNNFIVRDINANDNSLEFLNGIKIFAGDVIGRADEEKLRRLQIRETIRAHLEKEQEYFSKGIKVLSLFFIDEVSHYKKYDAAGNSQNGDFANWFEEEYKAAVAEFQQNIFDDEYKNYLAQIPAEKTHAGYFSIDKKGKLTNSKVADRKEKTSDDVTAYDLIMKNKELLLNINPQKSPVRFIFSHSALREGWDNPNVFQICTLKQSGSDIRKRQEVGRGLRLCVNQAGERIDGADVHEINILTVIAGESYEEFTKKLQSEISENVGRRPRQVTAEIFVKAGIDSDTAQDIYEDLISQGYLKRGTLTEKFYADKESGNLNFPEEILAHKDSIIKILGGIYKEPEIEDGRKIKKATFDDAKFNSPEFQELWKRINKKTVYSLNFDSDKFIERTIAALNQKLVVNKIQFSIETGELIKIKSKEDLQKGTAFKPNDSKTLDDEIISSGGVTYDIVGKITAATEISRRTVSKILRGIDKNIFCQFRNNPEDFILEVAKTINSQKNNYTAENISYNPTGENFDDKIFTNNPPQGILDKNALEVKKNLYDFLVYDSNIEKNFAQALDAAENVKVYVKLPSNFIIPVPNGTYNPDWAIAFQKKIYFVAEIKGSTDELELRSTEIFKIQCAKKHFAAISADKNFSYDVVKNFDDLINKVSAR